MELHATHFNFICKFTGFTDFDKFVQFAMILDFQILQNRVS